MSEVFEQWWMKKSPLSLSDKAGAKVAYLAGMEKATEIAATTITNAGDLGGHSAAKRIATAIRKEMEP